MNILEKNQINRSSSKLKIISVYGLISSSPPFHSMTNVKTNNPRKADTTTIGRLIDDNERIIGDIAEQEGEDFGDNKGVHEGFDNEGDHAGGDHKGVGDGADETDCS